MMRLSVALAALILAALFAAVAYVLARPRWRWEPPTVDKRTEFEKAYDALWTTGSPWSVTSRADNGSGMFV
jgi:hypothetical protein